MLLTLRPSPKLDLPCDNDHTEAFSVNTFHFKYQVTSRRTSRCEPIHRQFYFLRSSPAVSLRIVAVESTNFFPSTINVLRPTVFKSQPEDSSTN